MWREGGEASSPSSAQGCGSKKAPIFLFFPSSSPRNGTTHGGAPSEGKKLRHLLAVQGGGERRGGGERLCCSTTRRHLAQVSPSPRPAEGEGGRKKVQSKRVRAHSPRHGRIRRSDGSVSLGMCASHPAFGGMASLLPPRWSAAARGGHLSARPPSDGEEGGGGGGVSETCGLLLLLQASLH